MLQKEFSVLLRLLFVLLVALQLFLLHSYSTAYQCIYYSPEHTAKAREILSVVAQLQPLICSLAEHLLQQAQQRCSHSLREALKSLEEKVRTGSWQYVIAAN